MPKVKEDDETWAVYCRRDVEIMRLAWLARIKFLKDNRLGTFKLTLASQAMATYRYRFMTDRIHITHYDWQVKLERESYRGGRVEPFFVGKVEDVPLYKLDVNSMYPYVMWKYEYPTNIYKYQRNVNLYDLRVILRSKLATARVLVDVGEPVFPVRMDNRNVYPIGRFETVLTTPELEYALETSQLLEVRELITYDKARLFKSYVDFFYRLRLAAAARGDMVAKLMYKGLLNTAYGKWGQQGYTERVIGTCDPDDFHVEHGMIVDDGREYTHTFLGGTVTETMRDGESYNSFVAIASHVTAHARMYLWRLFQLAGRENVYYCDTDSLFVNAIGNYNLHSLCHDTQLGSLKVEGVSSDVTLNAPKDYVWDGKATLKGISQSAIKVRSYEYVMELWPSLRGHISRQQVDSFY